jgi:hypothetical protein
MTDPRAADTTPLNPPDAEPEGKLAELAGTSSRGNQDVRFDASEVDGSSAVSDTEIYEGADPAPADADDIEELVDVGLGLREGETGNPDVAAEEGEPWIPPIDPPVVADAAADDGMTIAAGFGTTAMDEPFDADHHGSSLPGDDEVSARVREVLLADSRTSRLAPVLRVDTAGGIVRVRGQVADLEDGDLVVEVVSQVEGVTEVRDETDVPGL